MVKYYCDVCNDLITKRYAVVVKTPEGETQPSIHLCVECHKVLKGYFGKIRGVKERGGEINLDSAGLDDSTVTPVEVKKTTADSVTPVKPSLPTVVTPKTQGVTTSRLHHSRLDVSKARRVLIDYYSGVSAKSTRERCQVDYNTYQRWIRSYVSDSVRKRYDENRTYTNNGETFKCGEVLSMYAAGLPLAEIERDTGFGIGLIEKVLAYFTGI